MPEIFDLTHIISTYGYLGIFIIVFLESGIFFALPGDSLLFTAGLLVSLLELNIFLLISLIFIATFTGGIVGYELGVHIEKLRRYAFFRKILKEEHIQKAHRFFEKHGKLAVILSRFVPFARTFVPIVAGISKMNYTLFLRYSFVSSVLWSTVMTLLGYFLGQLFPAIRDYVTFFIFGIVIASIIPVFWETYKERQLKL